MSQKRSDIHVQNIWTICPNLFSTWTICPNFILDDLSQVIFVTILFWTICHITCHICHNCILDDLSKVIFVLDDMSQKKERCSGGYVGRYGQFATIVFTRDDLSQLYFILGRRPRI